MLRPRADSVKSGTLLFEGKLLEVPSDAPRCGDIRVAVAYRFRIEKLLKGESQRKTVVVLIACPDLMGAGFFEAGALYRVEATAALDEARSHTVYNDYPKSPVLWSNSVTRLKRGRR